MTPATSKKIAAKLLAVSTALTDVIGEVEEAKPFDGNVGLAVSLVEYRALIDRQIGFVESLGKNK